MPFFFISMRFSKMSRLYKIKCSPTILKQSLKNGEHNEMLGKSTTCAQDGAFTTAERKPS